MNNLQEDLQFLFDRDLATLIENLNYVPDDIIWKAPEGVTNSCGILAQHIVGNLNHFICKGIGETEYVRNREKEFTDTQISKEELISSIEKLRNSLGDIFKRLDDETLSEEYSMEVPYDMTIRKWLIHLYGHLNYHLGQINYLRRIISKNG